MRRPAFAPTLSPLQSVRSSGARCSTAKAAFASGASRFRPSVRSPKGFLPLGLAHEVDLKRDLAEGECLKWSDVVYDENDLAVKVRREMEAAFGRPNTAGPPPS